MPRIALLSDVHGNLEALLAALDDLAPFAPDATVFLGDAVGYGPDPGPCVEILAERCDALLIGNHDEAALLDDTPAGFNPMAAQALDITRAMLDPAHMAEISTWRRRVRVGPLACTHGSFGPSRYAYVLDRPRALDCFLGCEDDLAAVGHTHNAAVFSAPHGEIDEHDVRWQRPPAEGDVPLPLAERCVVNPGSVGQPRDGAVGAAWALLDTDAMRFMLRRPAYDVEAVERKILAAGLPERLCKRLRVGA